MHMTIQPESEIHASFVFHGCTWLFRDALNFYGIRAVTYEDEGATQYCRAVEKLAVDEELGKDTLLSILDEALKNIAIRVRVEGGLGALSGSVKSFVQKLRSREDLHFT